MNISSSHPDITDPALEQIFILIEKADENYKKKELYEGSLTLW